MADRHQLEETAYELVMRGGFLKALMEEMRKDCMAALIVSKPGEAAEREALYHKMKGLDALEGQINSLADAAKARRQR